MASEQSTSSALERYLLLWLLLSSGAAYYWPTFAGDQLPDPFLESAGYLSWLIAATMFAIGLMLPRDEVEQVLRRWPTVFAGSAVQYTAMPMLAFCMGKLWGLEGDYLIGIIMVGCVPGAMASNVLTLNARGNTSYSVSLTTTATLLSPLVVPFVMQLALATEQTVTVPAARTSRVLLFTVVIPVVLGHLVGRSFEQYERHFRRWGALIANLAILWIIAVVVGLNREELAQFQIAIVLALLSVNVLGYGAGFCAGWGLKLPASMRRALTLEVGMQNAGLGASLATELFPDRSAIAIPPALYTFGCMLTGTILARIWGSLAQGKEPEAGTNVEE